MKAEVNLLEVPPHYAMCLSEECLKADTCLRQLAGRSAPATLEQWTIVSPKYLAALKDECPYYQLAEKVVFAKGFIGFLGALPYKQTQAAIAHLISSFGRRLYYRMRKGERLLSPAEQQLFRDKLLQIGISQPVEFDEYIESYCWR